MGINRAMRYKGAKTISYRPVYVNKKGRPGLGREPPSRALPTIYWLSAGGANGIPNGSEIPISLIIRAFISDSGAWA